MLRLIILLGSKLKKDLDFFLFKRLVMFLIRLLWIFFCLFEYLVKVFLIRNINMFKDYVKNKEYML